MANDVALTQLHPAVISTITNQNSSYATSSGIATMFAADVFECGKDNVTELVTTVDEFLFKYGQPNFKKYGQTAYNVINWLQANGEAYILRLLPDDAGFAHVLLNIQTKINSPDTITSYDSGKTVMKADGTLVAVNDVFIRPILTNVQLNNTSEELIYNELTNTRTDTTIDGYNNNFILAVYPKGRGDYYNKYGIRLTLNSTFDMIESMTNRVYNFELVEYDTNGNVTTVEGPFFVSFDPDSMSDDNESLYIEDVVNKYSDIVNIKVNDANYLKIAGIVNPNANPYALDILTGTTKEIDDAPQTFYCEATERYEDIHFYIQRYSVDGELITVNDKPVLNIPESDDEIVNQIIKLDNTIREKDHYNESLILEKMKEYYLSLCTQLIPNTMDSIYKSTNPNSQILTYWGKIDPSQTDATPTTNTVGDSLFNVFRTNALSYYKAKETYTSLNNNSLKAAYTSLKTASSNVISEGITPILLLINNIQALYKLASNNSEDNLTDFNNLLIDIKTIRSSLNSADKIDILISTNRSSLIDISELLTSYSLGETSNLPLENMEYIVSLLSEKLTSVIYNIINTLYTPAEMLADTIISNLKTSILELYEGDANATDTDANAAFMLQKGIIESLSLIKLGYIQNTVNNRQIFYGMCSQIISKLDDILIIASGKNSIDKISKLTPVLTDNVTTGITVDVDASSLGTLSNIIDSLQNIINSAVSMQTASDDIAKKSIIVRANTNITNVENLVSSKATNVFNNSLQNFTTPLKFSNGHDGSFAYNSTNNTTRTALIKDQLIKAYKGNVDGNIINRDIMEFRHIFDANYDVSVKNAVTTLCRDIRKDCFFWADTGFRSNPEDVLKWRKNSFNISSYYVGLFAQDLTYYDEYTSKNIRVTPTYVLSTKVPTVAKTYGLQYPIAGPRRGIIDGFTSISWFPNDSYKERFYLKRINYIEQDSRRTKLGSQLTTDVSTSALSDINNMMTLLDIKNNVEKLCSDYQFELSDSTTINALNFALNEYLATYTTNRSCESINCKVYASDYDKQQKILRVDLSIKFTGVVERILISLNVAS